MEVGVDEEGDELGIGQASAAGQILELFSEGGRQTNRKGPSFAFVVPTLAGFDPDDLWWDVADPGTANDLSKGVGISHRTS